jgi:hypothetical protein
MLTQLPIFYLICMKGVPKQREETILEMWAFRIFRRLVASRLEMHARLWKLLIIYYANRRA